MKLEVINCSTQKTIETYSVKDLSLFDFRQWEEAPHQSIPLNDLLESVAKLESRGSETEESYPCEVDFYLPDPLKRNTLSRFEESNSNTVEDFDQSEEMSEIADEGIFMSVLKSSTILSAVVTEILANHSPHSHYKVRISDG